MHDNYIQIGRLSKTYGTEGKVKYDIDDKFLDLIQSKTYIFLRVKGSHVPFYVEETDSISIKLEWVVTPELARNYVNCPIFLPAEKVPQNLAITKAHQFVGLQLYDQIDKQIGEIVEVEEFPMQTLLHVSRGGEIVLVPYHEDMYMEHDSNKLQCSLPDGLFDM